MNSLPLSSRVASLRTSARLLGLRPVRAEVATFQVRRITEKADIRRSVEFEHEANQGVWHFVPMLRDDRVHLMQGAGELGRTVKVANYTLEQRGRIKARVSTFVNRHRMDPKNPGSPLGMFGLFDTHMDVPGSALRDLCNAALGDLRQQGVRRVVGPLNGTEWQGFGLRVAPFDRLPPFVFPSNPEFYHDKVLEAGFRVFEHDVAYGIDFSTPTFREALEHYLGRTADSGVTMRPMRRLQFETDIGLMNVIYRAAFTNNWYHGPLDLPQLMEIMGIMRFLVPPFMFQFAEVDRLPRAFVLIYPDYAPVMKKLNGSLFPLKWMHWIPALTVRKPRYGSLVDIGVHPDAQGKGLGGMLCAAAFGEMQKRGYTGSDYGTISVTNRASCGLAERFGGTIRGNYYGYEQTL